MPLWFEIIVMLLLALIVLQLYGIEGNISSVANEITKLARILESKMKENK
jgi:hypothetical protein